MNDDPRLILAQRLRSLREEHWRDRRITQHQLAQALGGNKPISVPLISGWESTTAPKIPAARWIELYAAIFATPRCFDGPQPRLLPLEEMTEAERRRKEELHQELTRLRNDATRAMHEAAGGSRQPGGTPTPGMVIAGSSQGARSIQAGPWRFGDGEPITLVCAQLPTELRAKQVYADPDDPDYVALYTYADLDALIELYGHLRAANPLSSVDIKLAHELTPDAYSSHLISVGGTDWNRATRSVLRDLHLPVSVVANWREHGVDDDDVYFEVQDDDGQFFQHRPIFEKSADGRDILLYDVGLFARAVNPFNHERTVSICLGMYGRGTLGVVRTLTDARFRERNAQYLRTRFGNSESYFLLTRVPIVDGSTLTPQWMSPNSRLFEWSAPEDD